MSKLKILFVGVILSHLFTACSPTLYPFTDEMYQEFSKEELSKIQFYLSKDIVLYRDYGGKMSEVENGTIKIVDGRQIEEVVFKSGTPGVFLFTPKSNKIAVCFEENNENFLMFGASRTNNGRFVLLAKEWERNYGTISYAGKLWKTRDENAFANLLVDFDRARKTKVERKTVGGRKIEG